MSSLSLNRRGLLFGGTALAITACARKEGESDPKVYSMGKLTGRVISDLFAIYVGQPDGRLPAQIEVNWNECLDNMWERKQNRSPGNRVVVQTRERLLEEFEREPRQTLTLVQYQDIADREARQLHRRLDWDSIGRQYLRTRGKSVNTRKLRLLKNTAGKVRGRELMAYGLTELMPAVNDGALNRDFLDFLLRTGGRTYVERIPAIYDPYTSYGPYQFTSFALYDAAGGPRGASVVNNHLPERLRIPGSVMLLRGDQHFRAAYLFAVHNLAVLIKRLTSDQVATFERVWRTSDESLTEFIAVAHHGPVAAYRAGQYWLDNDARLPLRRSCSGRYAVYARKTANNYQALA